MPMTVLNGVRLYYEMHGHGTPLVLMHGFAGTADSWKPQIPDLSAQYQLILYDARGHWRSESPRSPDQYSPEIFAEDLRALLDHLKVTGAVVGGLSMGGVIALTLYFTHPERVRALILADTGPGFKNPAHREAWRQSRERVSRLLEEGGMAAFARSPYARADYYTAPEIMLQHDPVGLANVNRKALIPPDSRLIDRLPEIHVPTLVIVGADDADFLGASEYMARKITGARHVVIPKAGHGANVDQPEAFNRAILDFLKKSLGE